jgi:hypothetical protein
MTLCVFLALCISDVALMTCAFSQWTQRQAHRLTRLNLNRLAWHAELPCGPSRIFSYQTPIEARPRVCDYGRRQQ